MRQHNPATETGLAPAPAPHAVESPARGRVLVVDDDRLVREVLVEQLEEMGFDVLAAANGAEALGLLAAGEAVAAVICDFAMPGLDGVETIRRARALRPSLACYLLTGYVGERAILAHKGLFELICKPVSGEVLAARLRAV